jgi:predicted lipoprotein with Yx(FWY)xxD motif
MKRTLSILAPLTVGVAVLGTALAVGGSSASPQYAGPAGRYAMSPTASAARAAANSAISVRRTSLGKTLVDARGRTLYLFEADRPNASNCSSSCLSVWPALTSRVKPHALGGAVAAKIGTIRGPGGRRQVTYAKHPLYYYVADRKPGDTKGQGLDQFGAEWYVLSPAGRKIDNG